MPDAAVRGERRSTRRRRACRHIRPITRSTPEPKLIAAREVSATACVSTSPTRGLTSSRSRARRPRPPPRPAGSRSGRRRPAGRTSSRTGITSVSRKLIPSPVSFSKLPIAGRCGVHPSSSTGHPHRRPVIAPAIAHRDVQHGEGRRCPERGEQHGAGGRPRAGAGHGRLDGRHQVASRCTSSGASGARHPYPIGPTSMMP